MAIELNSIEEIDIIVGAIMVALANGAVNAKPGQVTGTTIANEGLSLMGYHGLGVAEKNEAIKIAFEVLMQLRGKCQPPKAIEASQPTPGMVPPTVPTSEIDPSTLPLCGQCCGRPKFYRVAGEVSLKCSDCQLSTGWYATERDASAHWCNDMGWKDPTMNPCPKCGGQPSLTSYEREGKRRRFHVWDIKCSKCSKRSKCSNSAIGYNTPIDAVTVWNKANSIPTKPPKDRYIRRHCLQTPTPRHNHPVG